MERQPHIINPSRLSPDKITLNSAAAFLGVPRELLLADVTAKKDVKPSLLSRLLRRSAPVPTSTTVTLVRFPVSQDKYVIEGNGLAIKDEPVVADDRSIWETYQLLVCIQKCVVPEGLDRAADGTALHHAFFSTSDGYSFIVGGPQLRAVWLEKGKVVMFYTSAYLGSFRLWMELHPKLAAAFEDERDDQLIAIVPAIVPLEADLKRVLTCQQSKLGL